jgi:hypothetical protein
MSRAIHAGWALAVATTLAAPALAASFPEKPPKESFVVDRANVIKPAQLEAINKTANALLREQEVPIFVVTIRSLSEMDTAGSSIEQYATALFNHWGIGSQQKNFGVLLLVSTGDRKARIELGSGWGGEHNGQAANVMQSLIIPAFKRNDYSTGIADGDTGDLQPAARAERDVLGKIRCGHLQYSTVVFDLLLLFHGTEFRVKPFGLISPSRQVDSKNHRPIVFGNRKGRFVARLVRPQINCILLSGLNQRDGLPDTFLILLRLLGRFARRRDAGSNVFAG